MHVMKLLCAALLAAGALSCSASSSEGADAPPAGTMLNTVCPMMGEAVDPLGGVANYKGHKVGFCCLKCAPRWEALSEEAKAEKLAAAGIQVPG